MVQEGEGFEVCTCRTPCPEDEEGYKINNKFGYFKNALESNFLKLENFKKDIYSEDYCEELLKDFEK